MNGPFGERAAGRQGRPAVPSPSERVLAILKDIENRGSCPGDRGEAGAGEFSGEAISYRAMVQTKKQTRRSSTARRCHCGHGKAIHHATRTGKVFKSVCWHRGCKCKDYNLEAKTS